MNLYNQKLDSLLENPKIWLITGVAGFIGSNLLECLLRLNQKVIGLDNFSTGHRANLKEVKTSVTEIQWANFKFIEGDICNLETCRKACVNIDYVLHQAALGSVPRSINNPIASNASNVGGFLNMLVASKDENVSSFTYAASSSTYGDHKALPKVENVIGKPLSPYAVTKYANELYADVFSNTYNFHTIGLRYFNVFGKRQNIHGAYAAVIPKWISSMINDQEININGDGTTSRDFCFIENAIQANILAACANHDAKNQVYNCALGDRTSLNELYKMIEKALKKNGISISKPPVYKDFRAGDVKHSQANIEKAKKMIGYDPEWKIEEGINKVVPWFINNLKI